MDKANDESLELTAPLTEEFLKACEIEDQCGSISAGCWEATPTLWDRIRWKLFPSKYCSKPETDFETKDCVRSTCVTKLSWTDRLRALVTGVIVVTVRVHTEFEVGRIATNSTCHIGTSRDWK